MSTYSQAGLSNSPLFMFIMTAFTLTLSAAIIVAQHQAVFMLAGLLFFILYVSYPVFGVYVTTFLLLLSGSQGIVGYVGDTGEMALTLSKLSGSAALAAWAINVLLQKTPFSLNWVGIWLSIFCMWAMLCTMLGSDLTKQMPEWVRLVTIFGFYLLSINALNKPRNVHVFAVVLVVCGFMMSVIALMQYLIPSWQVDSSTGVHLGSADAAFIDAESLQGGAAIRASGRAGHSNWLAFTVLLILPLNGYWYRCVNTKTLKAFIILSVLLQISALVLTYTRTGFLIGIVLVILMLTKKLVHLTPQRIMAFLIAVCFVYVMLPAAYKERVFTPKQYTSSQSVESRLQLQQAAARYTAENPIFGLGMGGFGVDFTREANRTANLMRYMVQYQQWNPVFIGTHNMYLEISASTGLPGLFFFICFYVLMVKKLYAMEQRYKANGDWQGEALASALFVSLVGFMLCSVFLHALTQKIWWMIAAMATVLPLYQMSFRGAVLTHFHTTTEDPRSQPALPAGIMASNSTPGT